MTTHDQSTEPEGAMRDEPTSAPFFGASPVDLSGLDLPDLDGPAFLPEPEPGVAEPEQVFVESPREITQAPSVAPTVIVPPPVPVSPVSPSPTAPAPAPVARIAPTVVAPPVDPDAFEQARSGAPVPVLPLPEAFDVTKPAALELDEPMATTAGRPALERFLAGLVGRGGSDLHLTHGEVPRFRVAGALLPVGGEAVITDQDLESLLSEALSERAWAEFLANGDLDTAYQMDFAQGSTLTSRFRINVARSMGHIAVVARVIPTKIVGLDDLGILPQVKGLATLPRGLVLVCGPTGSGKSTTLAGLIDLINTTRTERIWTFEDPIEFVHTSKKCLINHREIGEDTPSFVEGMRRVRREDPDIILVGEMRDYETIDAAIEAADTGHLVLATLHTNSAPETISRIINSFPSERQAQVRITLSSVLMSVVCQTLVPSPKAARGRVVASEIMMVTPAIRSNIRENDIPAIANALKDQTTGSISLDAHLAALVREEQITRNEANKKATSKEALERLLGSPA